MMLSYGSVICYEGEEIPLSRSTSSLRDPDSESGRSLSHIDTPAGAMKEIAMKCGTKVSVLPKKSWMTLLHRLLHSRIANEFSLALLQAGGI